MATSPRPSSILAILVRGAITAAALCGLLGATPAQAQPGVFPTVTARVGSYVIDSTTKIRLDAPGRSGSDVEFEDDLGVDKNQNLGMIYLEWQATRRNLFRVGYYRMDRSGEKTLADRSIDIGGVDYPIGSKVSADLKTTFYEVDWTWWFLRRERSGFGATLGAAVLDLDASAEASVRVGDLVQTRRSSASVSAPVPSIGLEGRAALTQRLIFLGYARALPNVTVGDVDGDALQFNLALEWMPWDHAGIGLSYHSVRIDSEVDASHYRGGLDLGTRGFQLYGRFSS